MPQRKSKTPHVTTKTWHNQINKLINESKTKQKIQDLIWKSGEVGSRHRSQMSVTLAPPGLSVSSCGK